MFLFFIILDSAEQVVADPELQEWGRVLGGKATHPDEVTVNMKVFYSHSTIPPPPQKALVYKEQFSDRLSQYLNQHYIKHFMLYTYSCYSK